MLSHVSIQTRELFEGDWKPSVSPSEAMRSVEGAERAIPGASAGPRMMLTLALTWSLEAAAFHDR
jgi:hypothetical protein